MLIIFSSALLSAIFVSYTFNNLPLKDYRPYKVGFDMKENYQENGEYSEVKINETTSFSLREGGFDKNVTSEFINAPSILVSTSYNFDKTNKNSFTQIKDLFSHAKQADIGVMQISDWQFMNQIKEFIGEDVIYYYDDSDIGKIIIRSDPGLILIKNGVIIKKWHYNNIPEIEEVKNLLK